MGLTGFSNRTTASNFLGNNGTTDYSYRDDGEKFVNGGQSGYGASYADGDIIGIALDLDTTQNTVTFYKNGASHGSINISSVSTCPDGAYFFAGSDNNIYAERRYATNFGNGFFQTTAVTSNSGNGYSGTGDLGIFQYQPPTGYTALSTKGLNL